MSSLEGDVMRSYARVCEVIKDQVMSDIQSAAVRNRVFTEEMSASDNLKALDTIVRTAVDQAARNGMREMQSSTTKHARIMDQLRADAKRGR